MFLDRIKLDIDDNIRQVNKKKEHDERINTLVGTVSNLKVEYGNLEDALCHKKDEEFMEVLTKTMEENNLTRVDEEVSYTGLCTYYKYKGNPLIMTLFPKHNRTRKLVIGLNSKAKVLPEEDYWRRNNVPSHLKSTFECEIWFWLKHDREYRDNYSSQEKSEEYYQTQIAQLNKDIKFIKNVSVDTGITLHVSYDDLSTNNTHKKTICSETSCQNAILSILNEVDKIILENKK